MEAIWKTPYYKERVDGTFTIHSTFVLVTKVMGSKKASEGNGGGNKADKRNLLECPETSNGIKTDGKSG